MSNQRVVMMPRDGAGQMDLIGGNGPIMHMIGLESCMEVYKADRTFQTQSPDAIDPGRTKPDVPWTWHISDEAGYANPIVARVFIQCAEALKNKSLNRGSADQIRSALHSCKSDLRNAEKAFRRLATEHDRIVQTIRESGGVRVERGVVNDLPQIGDLDHDTTIFLTSCKRALQSIAEVLNEFYGISISNARFDKGITQLKLLSPAPTSLLDCLNGFKDVIERVLNLRNFQEHTPKKTIIRNFHVTADSLLPPSWQVMPDPEQPMLPEMHELISALIELAELSFFHGLMDNLSGPFASLYSVREIPPEAKKQGSELRFECELTLRQSASSDSSEER